MMEWQPIISAPKDGSRVLLYLAAWDVPVVGWWCDDWGTHRDNRRACWVDFEGPFEEPPTHWTLFPPLPNVTPDGR